MRPVVLQTGVTLGVESFGQDGAPLVLPAGGTTMLAWPDTLCERLAAGGRRVVRYDLRDSGEGAAARPRAGGDVDPDAAAGEVAEAMLTLG